MSLVPEHAVELSPNRTTRQLAISTNCISRTPGFAGKAPSHAARRGLSPGALATRTLVWLQSWVRRFASWSFSRQH